MLVVVTTVSALVHLYSIGYMHEDASRPRFFAYLSLFTFAMLMLVTTDNLVQMFFGWEGVGLVSYLLIGFWYDQPGRQRRGHQGLRRQPRRRLRLRARHLRHLCGVPHRRPRTQVFDAAPSVAGQTFLFLGHEVDILTTLCLLLFMGAMGKSAQFLLHTWLPDAMEGPTPVSALIHAATMVTAGVFMVARLSPLFELAPIALQFVTLIGAVTAFFAATVGLVQNDIKRVIAYSTCSQLGYMFVACGVGAYGAGIFHLFTHAFFKALLFLGAGSVIHAMHHEQDMRKMGGLAPQPTLHLDHDADRHAVADGRRHSRISRASPASIPRTPSSRPPTLPRRRTSYAFWLLVIAAFMTAFYSLAADVPDLPRQDARRSCRPTSTRTRARR